MKTAPFPKEVLLCSSLFLSATFLTCSPALADVYPAVVGITRQPSNVSLCSGSTAFFSVAATGTPAVSYQWQVSTNGTTWNNTTNGTLYSGSVTARLVISAVPASLNGNSYRCVLTDGAGSTNSNPAVLTVSSTPSPFDPAIFQNASTFQCSNNTSGSVNGSNGSYNYQWQVSTDNGNSWTLITGGAYSNFTTNVLNFTVNSAFNGNLYQYLISDPANTGCAASSGLDTFYLLTPPASQVVTPVSGSICPASNFTFGVIDSTAFYTYQWQSSPTGVSWTNISNNATYGGTATNSLGITNTATALRYRTEVTVTSHGISCTVASNSAPLSIKTLPAITLQPSNDTACAGSTVAFKITASGTTPTFAWLSDNGTGGTTWSPTGITTATLTLTGVTPAMNGYAYEAVVTGCGSPLTSLPAILRVNSSGTWLGTTDTAWGNAPNWCGGVPGPTTNVLIPAAAPRMPLISTATGTAFSDALTIQSGAVLTISGGTTDLSGPFTIPGTVAYTGTADQQVLPANFGSLSISGSGNKILTGNSSISNTLTLGGNAMLVTGNDILTMNAGSNPINGPSFSGTPTSWIVTGNGSSGPGNTGTGGLRILQLGASAGTVLFPVGPAPTSYNPLTLTNGGAINDFTVAVSDQYIPGASSGSVIDRTWLVSAANSGSSNISLGMLWRQSDEPGAFDRANAEIVRSNGTALVEQSTASPAAGSNPYTTTGGSFSTLTQFSVGSSTFITLPVGLLSFSAQWIRKTETGLVWTVDPQYDGNFYTVERSADGIHFNPVGTITAEVGRTSYSFVDSNPGTNNFYRIELVDGSNEITYSHIVQLSSDQNINAAELAPSVVDQSYTNLLLSLNLASNVSYMLMDATGHTVLRHSAWLSSGEHTLVLDLTHLAGGVYFLRVITGQEVNKVLTLIKK